jgi:hypothetical protein
MSIKNGGPAFPVQWQDRDGQFVAEPGMTLRDYFAAKAMAALISEPICHDGGTPCVLIFSKGAEADGPDRFAIAAYKIADAMLRFREVQP